MSKLSLLEIAQSQLDTTPVIDGQLIICLDTGNAYRDNSVTHVKIGNDLEVVSELPLAPLANKLYYLRPDKLYAYNGGDWVLLNDGGQEFTGATMTSTGTKGAVPAPEKGGQRWLDSTGNWTVPENATQESAGFESPLDKIKLDGIEDGANKYVHPTYGEHTIGLYQIAVDDEGHVSTAQVVTSDDFDAIGVAPKEHSHDIGKMIDMLDTSDTDVTDGETVITGQPVVNDDETTTTRYARKSLATLWAYIKSKASTVFATINHNHKIQSLEEYTTRIWDATVSRTKGTVLAAPQAADGTATFRKLDKNDVGLGNVDNTADKNKNVNSATVASKLSTNAGSATNPIYFANGVPVAGTYTLGNASSKNIRSLSAAGNSGWANQATDDGYVPSMSFITYWNGAYSDNGSSNLQYCDRGRFGTIVSKSSGDYATAGHTHNSIKDIGNNSSNTTFAYSKVGMNYGDYTWLAGWNGYELRAVNKSQFATASHTHDDRYYTESEMNTKLNGKANASHTHDDRYYTESEINTKLNGKANSSHTHNYAGSSSAGGTANSVNGLTFAAQTTDPGAGSSLATNKVLIVYQ